MSRVLDIFSSIFPPLLYTKGFIDGEQKIIELLEKSNIRFWNNPFYLQSFSDFWLMIEIDYDLGIANIEYWLKFGSFIKND